MFNCNCINCNAKFTAKRSTAKFCETKCRVAWARARQDKKEDVIDKVVSAPKKIRKKSRKVSSDVLWKRNGFKSKEEAMLYAIGKLIENKKIRSAGLDEPVVVWRRKVIKL